LSRIALAWLKRLFVSSFFFFPFSPTPAVFRVTHRAALVALRDAKVAVPPATRTRKRYEEKKK
jgi:hypothetical protein